MQTNSGLIDAQIDAEKALLGAILLGTVCFGDVQLIQDVKKLISPADFMDYQFQGDRSRYYEAMIGCAHPDVITITHKLIETRQFKSGDCEYLNSLLIMQYQCSSYNYMDYARIVKDYSNKRGGAAVRNGGIELGDGVWQ